MNPVGVKGVNEITGQRRCKPCEKLNLAFFLKFLSGGACRPSLVQSDPIDRL